MMTLKERMFLYNELISGAPIGCTDFSDEDFEWFEMMSVYDNIIIQRKILHTRDKFGIIMIMVDGD